MTAVLALVFTIASFWWINARTRVSARKSPRGVLEDHDTATDGFRIPVVVYNTGARTRVVETLPLAIVGSEIVPLEWIATRDGLRPKPEDGRTFPRLYRSTAGER